MCSGSGRALCVIRVVTTTEDVVDATGSCVFEVEKKPKSEDELGILGGEEEIMVKGWT